MGLFRRAGGKNGIERETDIRRAMEQWQEAERYYKSVSDADLVDYAAYEAEAARRKYMLLLKRYAAEREYGEC